MPPDGSSGAETEARLGRKLVAGRLDLAFAADGGGRTYLARQYANYPFHVCRALYQDAERPGLATLYLQSCSGGLYEDDRLDMRLEIAEGAEAHVSTQGPTIVHTMPSGSARLDARIVGAPRSYLEYLPDPQILFPGSRCASRIEVSLGGDAVALISDFVPWSTIPMDGASCSPTTRARSSSPMRWARSWPSTGCGSMAAVSAMRAREFPGFTPRKGP